MNIAMLGVPEEIENLLTAEGIVTTDDLCGKGKFLKEKMDPLAEHELAQALHDFNIILEDLIAVPDATD